MTASSRGGYRKLLLFLSLAAFALLGFAGFRLLLTAFEVGDVYPSYSSLSSDLEGTEVFYEALEALPGLRVSRSYVAFGSSRSAADTTLLAPGFSPYTWKAMTEREARALRALIEQGARVVVAFDATPLPAFVRPTEESKKKATEPAGKKPGATPATEAAPKEKKPPAIEKELAVKVDYLSGEGQKKVRWRVGAARAVATASAPAGLPAHLEWSWGIQLTAADPAWRVLYQEAGRPAVLERRLGKGSLVILTDSYLLTNRAMWKSRRPDFLIWLLGGRKRILFQEAQLGISDNPGVAWLARKYRLHGLFAALIALLALYGWKESASASLAPVPTRTPAPPGDSQAGLVALLARSIPHSQVLNTCLDEWARTERHDPEALERLRRVVTAAETRPAPEPRPEGGLVKRSLARARFFATKRLTYRRDPVHAYNEIVRHCTKLPMR